MTKLANQHWSIVIGAGVAVETRSAVLGRPMGSGRPSSPGAVASGGGQGRA